MGFSTFYRVLGGGGWVELVIWRDDLVECLDTLLGASTLSIKFQNNGDGVIWCLTSIYGHVRPYEG